VLNKSGIDDIRPNGIISTAMPLHDYQRKAIEQALGTPVTNRYGCEEVSLIACQCERHQGLHVAAESVYVETASGGRQPADSEPIQRADARRSPNTGPLLVTDLVNFAMPLIRYQIGDVATLSDTPCSCGRGLPVLEKVEGRDADYVVTPSGSLISGISLTENFAVLIKGAAQVQIIQETITHLRVRMVRDPIWDAESERQIRDLVLKTFGPTMTYDLEFVDLIPQEPSGKYRFCVSKVSAEYLKGLSARTTPSPHPQPLSPKGRGGRSPPSPSSWRRRTTPGSCRRRSIRCSRRRSPTGNSSSSTTAALMTHRFQ